MILNPEYRSLYTVLSRQFELHQQRHRIITNIKRLGAQALNKNDKDNK